MTRIDRARQSLDGLRLGDAFGEQFFVRDPEKAVAERRLREGPWRWTDDTAMASSVVEVLSTHGRLEQDALAASFARCYDVTRGYGPAMHRVLGELRLGRSWRVVAPAEFGGQGSWGNGAAMRVAPLGAFYADDLRLAASEAAASAVVTHAHPEAAAGAVAVAVAAGLAVATDLDPAGFLATVAAYVPPGLVQDGVLLASTLGTRVDEAAAMLGNGSQISAPDTVPFALWSAAHHLDDLEACLWATVTALGDRDTTCAIAAGVVAARTGVDAVSFLDRVEPPPSGTSSQIRL